MGTQSEDELWSRLRQKSQSARSARASKKRPQQTSKTFQEKPSNSNNPKKSSPARTEAKSLRPSSRRQPHLFDTETKKKPKQIAGKSRKIPPRKFYLIGGAVAVVMLIGGGVYFGLQRQSDRSGPQSLGITDEMQANLDNIQPVEEVSFRPFYPADFDERGIEFIQQMRGDTEYVTYVDSLDGTNFTVTQQLVTEEIAQAGDDQVESLAKAMPIPSTGVIQIDDTKVFVGTSEQNRQALLFTKDNVLLFITTEGLINESSWVGYIASLINST